MILIKGLNMPKDGERLCIDIHPDGKVSYDLDLKCKQIATAISVPPHGDLIERDMVHEIINWTSFKPPFSKKQVRRFIDNAPTIIEAEEGDG